MANKNKQMKECIDYSILISRYVSQNNQNKLKEIEENMEYLRKILANLIKNTTEKDHKLEKSISNINGKIKKMLKIFEKEEKWHVERYLKIFDIDYVLKLLLNELNFLYITHKSNTEEELKEEEAKKFWIEKFGRKNSVKKERFMKELQKHFGTIDEKLTDTIEYYLDPTKESEISIFHFQRFLELFGPFGKMIDTIRGMIENNVYITQVPSLRAEFLLLNKPQGSYLLRFSKSRSDSFAISYIDCFLSVKHTLLIKMDGKYYIKGCSENFNSIAELLEYYQKKLFLPLQFPDIRNHKKLKNPEKKDKYEKENLVVHYKNDILKTLKLSATNEAKPNQVNMCSICHKRNKDSVLDCQHFICCYSCSKKLKMCPLCNQPNKNPFHLFVL